MTERRAVCLGRQRCAAVLEGGRYCPAKASAQEGRTGSRPDTAHRRYAVLIASERVSAVLVVLIVLSRLDGCEGMNARTSVSLDVRSTT